jgi:hypothetical protein
MSQSIQSLLHCVHEISQRLEYLLQGIDAMLQKTGAKPELADRKAI